MLTSFTHPTGDVDAALAALVDAGFELGPPRRVVRTVLDTFDGHLHDAGLRLLSDARPARLELRGARSVGAVGAVDAAPPTWPADLPAGVLRDELAERCGIRALLPVARISGTARAATLVDDAGATVAVVELLIGATARVVATGTGATHRLPPELVGRVPAGFVAEVVFDEADRKADRPKRRLRKAGLVRHDVDAATIVAAASGVALAGHDGSLRIALDPSDDALSSVRRVLAVLADQVEANVAGTIADLDTEFLHDLRVAVRRTRSVLGEAKAVLPPEVRADARQLFGDLGRATGPARDLDVLALAWEEATGPFAGADLEALAPLRAHLEERRLEAHAALVAVLRDRTVRRRLAAWRRWLASPLVEVGPAPQALGSLVGRRLRKSQKALLHAGRAITEDSPDTDLHELRKDAKKLRYLLECFAAVLPPKETKAFVKTLKRLQEHLGDLQDAAVQAEELHEAAFGLVAPPAAALVETGRAMERLDRRRLATRATFAERFADYDSAWARAALRRLADG